MYGMSEYKSGEFAIEGALSGASCAAGPYGRVSMGRVSSSILSLAAVTIWRVYAEEKSRRRDAIQILSLQKMRSAPC